MIISDNRTTNWEGVQEWFESNGYDPAEAKVGYNGYYAKGYQDADCIEVIEDAECAEFRIRIDGKDVL